MRFLLTTDDIISDFNKYKFKTNLANNVYKGLMTFHILHYKCNLKTGSNYILNKTAKQLKCGYKPIRIIKESDYTGHTLGL